MKLSRSVWTAAARAGLLATFAFITPALAQSYRDGSGTIVPGEAPLVGCSMQGHCLGPVSATNPLPVSGAFWQSTQPVSLSTLPPLPAGSNTIGAVESAGTVGVDYSTNKPVLPSVGAGFSASGVYANYVLIATVGASPARDNLDIENTSGAQIAIVRDDGSASTGAPPSNASVFSLGGGAQVGAQGGAWTSQTFKGRVQIYAPSSTAQVAIFVD
jgi:hypothetical protein